MRKTALLVSVLSTVALAVTPRHECPRQIASARDYLAFEIESADEEARFLGDSRWTTRRYEQVAEWIEPDARRQEPGNPVIYAGLFNQYELATGVKVDLRLRQGLDAFLTEKGIKPEELKLLDSGVQGALFTHPKLGHAVLKVMTDALQNGGNATSDQSKVLLGEGKRCVLNFHVDYDVLRGIESQLESHMVPVFAKQIERLKRNYRGQAKHALHRAQQLMLPAIVAAQAEWRYYDFARVLVIGNGFLLREYYEDSEVHSRLALRKVLEAFGDDPDKLLAAEVERVTPLHPVLGHFFQNLVVNVPSFFVSRTLYGATRTTKRPRLAIIYDLD